MKTYISTCRKFASALLALGLCTIGIGSANALVINLADGPTNFAFSSTGGPYDLSVTGSLDITALTATSATLSIVLNNASTLTGGGVIANATDARLTSFGFGINPNVTSVTFLDNDTTGMVGASLSQIPSLRQIEVCTFGGPNCSGGGNGGIAAGGFDVFSLTLTGNFNDLTALTFDPLGVKFQTKSGSFEFACSGSDCGSVAVVPEPTTIALFGLGLLGLGAFRRKSAMKSQA